MSKNGIYFARNSLQFAMKTNKISCGGWLDEWITSSFVDTSFFAPMKQIKLKV